MTEQAQQPQLTQAQQAEWARIQFQKANKHLAENGVLFESVVTDESRYLAPYLAVWKIKEDRFLIHISQQFTFLRIVESWLTWFTEAMLYYSFLWVTKYFIIALDTSIRVFNHMWFFFHFIK